MIPPRHFNSYFGILFALLLSSAVADPTVQVTGLQGFTEPAPLPPAVFGNRDQEMDIEVCNATPKTGPLMADLFQVSGELSMPLSANFRLLDTVTLTGSPSQKLHVSIKFPNVKQRAEILVRVSMGGATPTPLGDLRFEVFSTDVTKELTSLFQARPDGSVPIVLFGSGRKLRTFLGTTGARFDNAGAEAPDHFESNRLYLGESPSAKEIIPTQEIINTAHVAVFAPDSSLPPGIYAERQGAGAFVRITQPLLDNLGADPRAQIALIKIVHLLNQSSSSNNSSSL